MRTFVRFGRVPAALLVVLPIAAHAGSAQMTLSPAAMARAGIAVATLHTVRMAPSIPAVGVVLDPAPLIQLSGEIAATEAAVSEAKAKVALEGKLSARSVQLYQGRLSSALEYEKARAALGAAQITLALALTKRRLLLAQTEADWGPVVTAALRGGGEPLPQIASHTAMLVGLSLPPGKFLIAPPREVEAQAQGIRFTVRLIAAVPRMLRGFPGQAILYKAPAQPGIPIGATVSASLPTGPERTGVLVPWSAVLWKGDKAIVFRAADGGHFEPVPIATDAPTEGGYFVAAPLAPGNQVVVRGAALLLGGSPKPVAGGEEDDEDD